MITIPGKIPITIHPLFWLLMIAIGWMNSLSLVGMLIWGMVIFVSVLTHEFGHALTAVAFGQNAAIDLIGTGGLTTRNGKKLKLWQEFIVVLNGPLAGISLYLLAVYFKSTFPVLQSNTVAQAILNVTVIVNLFWTILNLMPVQPLDGGRLLSIILEKLFGLRGIKIALFLSMCLAAFLAFIFFYFNSLLAGSIFFIFMLESYRNWRVSLSLMEQDTNTHFQDLFKQAERDLHFGRMTDAEEKLKELRKLVPSGQLYISATQHLGYIYAQERHFQAAYDLLKPLVKKLDSNALSHLHQVTYQLGQWEEGAEIGRNLYRLSPSPETAFVNALCEARLANKKATLGWLQTAQREGLRHFEELLHKAEFDFIRDEPMYQNLLSSAE